jgi:hypothetical protein
LRTEATEFSYKDVTYRPQPAGKSITGTVFYFVDRLTVLRLTVTGEPLTATSTNFADHSACLMADNVRNEGRHMKTNEAIT